MPKRMLRDETNKILYVMIPEELLNQAIEECPEYSDMFNLTNAINYLEFNPNGDTNDYILYCLNYT
jgi:hypothetical protein